jgi:MT-A70 protein
MVAAKLATLRDGKRADLVEGLPIGRASALLNVGEVVLLAPARLSTAARPELAQAVERGRVSVSAASDVATLPEQDQREIVARGEREILRAAQQIRARKAEMRRAENTPFPSDRRYAVLYADPPWHFEVYNEESGIERAAGNHYPTMELAEICALPVADIATDDAILFMWTTAPHLGESFEVLEAWGFEYKQCCLGEGQAWPGLLRAQSARTASDRHSGRLPMSAASKSAKLSHRSSAPRTQPQA